MPTHIPWEAVALVLDPIATEAFPDAVALAPIATHSPPLAVDDDPTTVQPLFDALVVALQPIAVLLALFAVADVPTARLCAPEARALPPIAVVPFVPDAIAPEPIATPNEPVVMTCAL